MNFIDRDIIFSRFVSGEDHYIWRETQFLAGNTQLSLLADDTKGNSTNNFLSFNGILFLRVSPCGFVCVSPSSRFLATIEFLASSGGEDVSLLSLSLARHEMHSIATK